MTVLDQYEDKSWKKLPEWVQDAASILGYTQQLWDNDKEPPTESKSWKGLTEEQQEAATKLGYNAQLWDDDDDSDEDSDDEDPDDGGDSDKEEEDKKGTVLDQFEDSDWKDLPEWVREAASALGYTNEVWDNDEEAPTEELAWNELTVEQQEAATKLSYTANLWDDDDDGNDDDDDSSCSSGDGTESVLDKHEHKSWKKLPLWVREHATVLGYTKKLWDNDKEPATTSKSWKELSESEQQAATKLGFDAELWEDDGNDDSTVVLYCVQLYSETRDFKLKVDDLKGLSMYANRSFDADEIIIQSPVGPTCQQSLLQAAADASNVSPERQAFAERFLEWQTKYGSSEAVGTTEDRPPITLRDFSNPPSANYEYFLPTTDRRSYYFSLRKTEVVVVEFVSKQQGNDESLLPPERRFEVLPYDEGIIWDGEEGYNPATMKRPPTLLGKTRELEIPGHFSNHACGSTATAYDLYRLTSTSNKNNDSSSCPLVAPGQPAWVQHELETYVQTRVFPDSLPTNMITTHGTLEAGEEILTDYALWHWSNIDGIPNGPSAYVPLGFYDETTTWNDLPLAFREAATVLGYSQDLWENGGSKKVVETTKKEWKDLTLSEKKAAKAMGYTKALWRHDDDDDKPYFDADLTMKEEEEKYGDWAEPWFYCLCGDEKCHSAASGFRGVKFFPLKEQQRLYWVCSPWIQNQMDWKIHRLEEEEQKE